METILEKPIDIITYSGLRLIGVTKIKLDLQFDIITFYMENIKHIEKNEMYTIINYSTVETGN